MSAVRFCLLSAFLVTADAGSGLRGQPQVSAKDVESSLLAELAGTFRSSATSQHISKLEAALGPMYTAVPKEADGTLSHVVVRYMLHRFFVQQNGWFIRGLEPGSGQQNTGANQTLQNLQEWVPSYLQGFLEELQGGRGISLRELAVLAGTLEDLIHTESVSRLDQAFNALELPHDSQLDEIRLQQALEVYMMIYMLGGNFSVKGPVGVLRAHKIFSEKLKDWERVQEWMHDIQHAVAPASVTQNTNFSAAVRVVEEIGRRYGTYNDGECNSLKSELLQIESTKAGRVRLTEFYKKGLTGVFEFNEKIDYLRTLGALDESDPAQPHVILPNYVAARPNCLVASNFYAVCCRNECEDLMSLLEQKIAASTAKPEQILEIVSAMPSATVTAPRNLSDVLLKRLYGIAEANQGSVPLHGRLFAQWMHHAFPRECPYPQQAGTTSPQTPDEWMQATGQENAKHSTEEMQAHVDSDKCTLPKGPEAREHHNLKENELPWDATEELLHPVRMMPNEPVEVHASKPRLRVLVPMAGVASSVVGLAIFVWKLMPPSKASKLPLSC